MICPILIVFSVSAWSYEIPDEKEYIARTCSISVSLSVLPDPDLTKPTGRGKVVVTLCDNDGSPYREQTVELSANAGTFACQLPEEKTDGEEPESDCFTTGDDGKANLFLINIPLNRQVQVKAAYDCGDYTVNSTASLVISRGKAKRKKQIRIKPR